MTTTTSSTATLGQAFRAMRWRSFAAAPHRMFFFGGVWALVLSVLWWAAVLLPVPMVVPAPRWLHGWLMIFGSFPFFVFGFLFTAMPRWLGLPAFAPRFYRLMACSLMAGYMLTLIGALWMVPVAAVGMLLSFVTWLVCALALIHLVWRKHDMTQIHALWAAAVIVAGALGALGAAKAVISSDFALLYNAPRFGLWAFLAPIVFIVAHRMLPFFASIILRPNYDMFRPRWAPAVVVGLFWIHALLMLTGHTAWLFVTDIPLLIITGWHLWQWQPWRTRQVPLLWTLFVAFSWLPVALLLSTMQSLAMLLQGADILGLAPLHALAVGLAASMVMAMATRVSMGHSGRPLTMERHVVVCFLVLQLAALARICAQLPSHVFDRGTLLMVSGVLWLIAFTPWALRLSVMYWQPRVDGRPG